MVSAFGLFAFGSLLLDFLALDYRGGMAAFCFWFLLLGLGFALGFALGILGIEEFKFVVISLA